MTYFQDDNEEFHSFLRKTQGLIHDVDSMLEHIRYCTRSDMKSIMGIDNATNSSKTVTFLIFCIENRSTETKQDDERDDAITIVTTTDTITEMTASNGTKQGITLNNILIKLLFLK